jgi:hypothetical protein
MRIELKHLDPNAGFSMGWITSSWHEGWE